MKEKKNSNKYKYKNIPIILICAAVIFVCMIYLANLDMDLEEAYASSEDEETSLADALSNAAADENETTQAATETTVSASLYAEDGTTQVLENGTNTVYTVDGTTYVVMDIDTDLEDLESGQDSGNSNYVIYVNLSWNVVTVCTTDDSGEETPVKAFYCSTAREGKTTPEGEFEMGVWYEWCSLVDGTYGQYSYRLTGDSSITHILFHSVPYLEMSNDSLEWGEYDKLGEDASLGCIRLAVCDARWLCENVGSGSKVIIYSDESSAGPLTPTSACFIPPAVTQICGWDPTDPDEENPWLTYSFTFDAEDEIEISAGEELDITEYVTAVDCYENDLSEYAVYTVDGEDYGFTYTPVYVSSSSTSDQADLISISYENYTFTEAGTYEISVSVSAGLITASRTIIVNVTE